MKLLVAFVAFVAGIASMLVFAHFLDESIPVPFVAIGAAGLFIAMVAGIISGK